MALRHQDENKTNRRCVSVILDRLAVVFSRNETLRRKSLRCFSQGESRSGGILTSGILTSGKFFTSGKLLASSSKISTVQFEDGSSEAPR